MSSPSEPTAASQADDVAAEPQAAIDAAVVGLDGLDSVPVGEHAEAFDRVHTALTEALSAIDGV